ncbi:MAG: PQQ-like beta-propeller repeat protein, partial [Gammaproteobacteria bacterium]|nr:PQQ-like beta-propeller repeat protein [Gammaproteobacteria bacterium]
MQLSKEQIEGSIGTLESPKCKRLPGFTLVLIVVLSFLSQKLLAQPSLKVINSWTNGNSTVYPFTLDGDKLFLNGVSTVEALDIQKGKKLWSQKLDSLAVFRPRLTEKLVISSGREKLSAWDRLTGNLSWSYKGQKELGVPLLYQGRIYLGEGHRLVALDAENGEPQWSFETDSRARVGYAPTASDDTIFLGAGDGVLYAIGSKDGKLLWKVDNEKDWQYLRQLAVTDDILIAGGYHDEIFGIDKSNGDIIWRFNAGNFINSQLVTDEAIFFWSPTGWIYALNTNTGQVLWRHLTVDYRNPAKKSNW